MNFIKTQLKRNQGVRVLDSGMNEKYMSLKLLMFLGVALLLAGALWLRVTFTLEGHIFSALLIIAGLSLVLVSEIKK